MISGLSAARVGRLDMGMIDKIASLTQPCACRQTCVALDDSSGVLKLRGSPYSACSFKEMELNQDMKSFYYYSVRNNDVPCIML